jgi:hypothetical protein
VKKLLMWLAATILAACLLVAAYKGVQKLCWDNKASFVNPPSLDSWDPTERFESARQAGKKWGGK